MIDWSENTSELLVNPRLPRAEHERLEAIAAAHDAPGRVWLATSGASGPVKLVAHTRASLLASAAAVNAHLDADAFDVWVNVLPLFHVGGLGIEARARLSSARVCGDHDGEGMPPPWSARGFMRTIEREAGTLSALVPAQVHDLVAADLRAPVSLRAVVVGGSALDPELWARARALRWPLLPSYGATECGSQIATAPLDALDEEACPPLILLAETKVAVTDDALLRVHTPALFAGYGADATPAGFVDPRVDGWWTTEDRGSLDADGAVTIAGRGADFFTVGGENVGLPRLERILAQAVETTGFTGDAALLPTTDARLGHVVTLVYAGGASQTVDTLRDAFNAEVAPFERIRLVRRLPELPRTPLAKLDRPAVLRGLR